MPANPYDLYRQAQTQTAPAVDRTVMLYQGAIKFLNQAAAAMDQRDVSGAHNGLIRAQAIIEELMVTLDLEAGPVAASLYHLYDYMIRRLVEANCAKDRLMVAEVLGYLKELLPAWQQAFAEARKTATARTGGAGEYVRVS